MKKYFMIMLAAVTSGAAYAADYVDTAKVISSVAITERVSDPKQECWVETVSSNGVVRRSAPVEERSIGGALLGGLIGGVVGSQVGQGNGSTVATGVGAIAGAIIGDRVANENQDTAAQTQQVQVPQTREERHCRQIESYRDVIRGYNVTYRYSGQDVTVRMPYDPGSTVKVGVSVLLDTAAPQPVNSGGGEAREYRRDNRERRTRDHGHDDW
ncbi:MAG: glycine zipper 2TM domain-containing protein [Nitrosomonadales bacterium]|nr:glycine zipper 2TM domain-containing protein [Nitrosomonadales bacterium]